MRFKEFINENDAYLYRELLADLGLSAEKCHRSADGKWTVNQTVVVHLRDGKYPLKFDVVNGDFHMSFAPTNKDFSFMPSTVTGNMHIGTQGFTDIQYLPKQIGGCLSLLFSGVTSLVGIADAIEFTPGRAGVEADMKFLFADIKEGGLGLLLVKNLKRLEDADGFINTPNPFKIIKKYLGKPEAIFDCQEELINAGFEAYAKL